MDGGRGYQGCPVMGEGSLYLAPSGLRHKLDIVHISAAKVRIRTKKYIEPDAVLFLELVFSSPVMGVVLKAKAVVSRAVGRFGSAYEYELDFIGLGREEKTEIDEIIFSTCGFGAGPEGSASTVG